MRVFAIRNANLLVFTNQGKLMTSKGFFFQMGKSSFSYDSSGGNSVSEKFYNEDSSFYFRQFLEFEFVSFLDNRVIGENFIGLLV